MSNKIATAAVSAAPVFLKKLTVEWEDMSVTTEDKLKPSPKTENCFLQCDFILNNKVKMAVESDYH